MKKEQVLSRIQEAGIVAVLRADSPEAALRIADACIEAGIVGLEVAFTTPGTHKVIEQLAARFTKGEIILGAGTVLDPETARIAILSGAQYLISPCINPESIRMANRYRIPFMPGAQTVSEVLLGMELGCDIIKLFPGNLLGPTAIKAILGPIPQAQIMPTGGVDVSNVGEWIAAGAVAVGAGGNLFAGAKTGDYASITRTGKEFIAAIKAARSK